MLSSNSKFLFGNEIKFSPSSDEQIDVKKTNSIPVNFISSAVGSRVQEESNRGKKPGDKPEVVKKNLVSKDGKRKGFYQLTSQFIEDQYKGKFIPFEMKTFAFGDGSSTPVNEQNVLVLFDRLSKTSKELTEEVERIMAQLWEHEALSKPYKIVFLVYLGDRQEAVKQFGWDLYIQNAETAVKHLVKEGHQAERITLVGDSMGAVPAVYAAVKLHQQNIQVSMIALRAMSTAKDYLESHAGRKLLPENIEYILNSEKSILSQKDLEVNVLEQYWLLPPVFRMVIFLDGDKMMIDQGSLYKLYLERTNNQTNNKNEFVKFMLSIFGTNNALQVTDSAMDTSIANISERAANAILSSLEETVGQPIRRRLTWKNREEVAKIVLESFKKGQKGKQKMDYSKFIKWMEQFNHYNISNESIGHIKKLYQEYCQNVSKGNKKLLDDCRNRLYLKSLGLVSRLVNYGVLFLEKQSFELAKTCIVKPNPNVEKASSSKKRGSHTANLSDLVREGKPACVLLVEVQEKLSKAAKIDEYQKKHLTKQVKQLVGPLSLG